MGRKTMFLKRGNKRTVTDKVFIIAEAGVNHNGSIKIAKRLIDAASQAGADAVKFQTFKAESLVSVCAPKAEYQKNVTDRDETQLEMLKKLELTAGEFKKIAGYAKKKNIIFLSSPFDKESADALDKIGIRIFKIPSGEITNIPLLKHIARKGKPVILSTGMSDLKEIKAALGVIRKEGVKDITLLQCVTNYPASIKDVNLRTIQTMKRFFKLPVGFSDHTTGIIASIVAVALGASVIEKHFTLDKSMSGPDHKASLEPEEFREMVKAIRDVGMSMGDGIKRPAKSEDMIKKVVRKSVVSSVYMPKGAVLTREMIDIKRPGTGIPPALMNQVIGKRARVNIAKDSLINFKDLA
ncbi:MAG: N-acetylneuraminate synthase [Candidatus Omnitrophota bacterium]|nr:N-acetylneuraminate synthase [Candidatus Omnitrophota bacterium]